MRHSICFYFPYYEDSGVPVLFYRMANTIAKLHPEIDVFVIDFENGAMARNLLDLSNLKLIVFEKKKKVILPKRSVLVMQTFIPYYWPYELELESNQKIFFWNLHPQNLIPSLLPLPFLRSLPMNNFIVYKTLSFAYSSLFKKLQKYILLLNSTDSLYFMDKTNLDFTSKYLFIDIKNKQYLPVPAVVPTIDVKFGQLKNVINIGWVGRLCDFKSYILVYTINKLSEIAPRFDNKKFIYHIVGDGPYLDYIKKNIKQSVSVSVVFHGALPHHELDSFISTHFDIMTAMGTSALEGAKLTKPTILLDFTFKKIKKDYLFRNLYDTEGFDLAHLISDSDYKKDNDSLFSILSKIILEYPFQSQKALQYFNEHHNIENVQSLFIEKVTSTKLIFSMIDPEILRKSRLLTFYNKLRKLEK
jgi:hypothetical protein